MKGNNNKKKPLTAVIKKIPDRSKLFRRSIVILIKCSKSVYKYCCDFIILVINYLLLLSYYLAKLKFYLKKRFINSI